MSGLPIYLDGPARPALGLFDPPAPERSRDTGVLIVPPFGWDQMCSYRERKLWGGHLSAAGHPVLRLDLPATGDSPGSPGDPGLLGDWLAAVAAAAAWLRSEAACPRVAGIGIGLGGFLLGLAIADGTPFDDLVLWATRSRGRDVVRELGAFARLEAPQIVPVEGVERPALADGDVQAGGYRLAAETRRAIEAEDLGSVPHLGAGLRVLLLERDGIAVEAALRDHLVATGATLEVDPGRGYNGMMDEPQFAVPPRAVFAASAEFLAGAAHRIRRRRPSFRPRRSRGRASARSASRSSARSASSSACSPSPPSRHARRWPPSS